MYKEGTTLLIHSDTLHMVLTLKRRLLSQPKFGPKSPGLNAEH